LPLSCPNHGVHLRVSVSWMRLPGYWQWRGRVRALRRWLKAKRPGPKWVWCLSNYRRQNPTLVQLLSCP